MSATSQPVPTQSDVNEYIIRHLRSIGLPPISEITPRIYLGSFEAATDSVLLRKLGITHIINCAKDAIYDSGDVAQIRLELDDIPQENLFRVLEPSRMVMRRILTTDSDYKILVHCMAGISRSASVVIYYLMKLKGWTYDETFADVVKKRSVINPNEGFVATLKSTQKGGK